MNSNNDRTSSTQHPTTEATDAHADDRQSDDADNPLGPHRQDQRSPQRRLPLILHPSWKRRAAPWRQTVQRRRVMLHNDLLSLDLTGEQDALRTELIDVVLADADIASRQLTTISRWWWGTEIERAWARLREVEERIVELLPEDKIRVRAAAALSDEGSHLSIDDLRRKQLMRFVAPSECDKQMDPGQLIGIRAATVEVLRDSHKRSTQRAQQARFLRNRVLLASAITAVFAVLVVVGQAHLSQAKFLIQPDGWGASSWQFLTMVMLLGCVGSLFTAIPKMAAVPPDFSPFNLPLQQAILKIVYGAVAALAGMAIVNTGTLNTELTDSIPGVVVLSLLFGAGQQFVTGFVDRQAEEILTSAESDNEQVPSTTGVDR